MINCDWKWCEPHCKYFWHILVFLVWSLLCYFPHHSSFNTFYSASTKGNLMLVVYYQSGMHPFFHPNIVLIFTESCMVSSCVLTKNFPVASTLHYLVWLWFKLSFKTVHGLVNACILCCMLHDITNNCVFFLSGIHCE